MFFNAGALDDRLREEDCRANVIHTAPTRSMLADGLAQYLAWKKWSRWFLVTGSHPQDRLFADALRRAAKRFGAKIVAEKEFADTGGARRTDSGVVQVQRQMPVFTRAPAEYDVLVAGMPRVLRTRFIDHQTLYSGDWGPALERLLAQPPPPETADVSGADVTADLLLGMI